MTRCPNHPKGEPPRPATVLFGARFYCEPCGEFLLRPFKTYLAGKARIAREVTQKRCAALRTRSDSRGQPCAASALPGGELCYMHARMARGA